jgi:hypothetical protein
MCDGVVLPEKDRFKYLGMLLDRRINPKIAEEHAVRPYMAAQSRISEFVKSYRFLIGPTWADPHPHPTWADDKLSSDYSSLHGTKAREND